MNDYENNTDATTDESLEGANANIKTRKPKKIHSNQIVYTRNEEIMNFVTHIVGAALSLIGAALLIVRTCLRGDALAIVSVSIFSLSMLCMFLFSALYHAMPVGKKRRAVFRRLDHCAIAFMIAGTYAPLMLIGLGGWMGITIASVVLGIAVIVIVLNAINVEKFRVVSLIAYVIMGWACIIAIKPLYDNVGLGCLLTLLSGGVIYTLGIIFYKMRSIPFNHAIWHIFVLLGSVGMFLSIYLFLV